MQCIYFQVLAKQEKMMNKMIEDALQRVINASGLIGDPARFEVSGPEPHPGTMHPFPQALTINFPLPVAILVLAINGDTATVCPVVVPPGRDYAILPDDRWLPSDESPFRMMPGTGVMQVRTGWSTMFPCNKLQPAVRQIDLAVLVDASPIGRSKSVVLPVVNWHDKWIAAVDAMKS